MRELGEKLDRDNERARSQEYGTRPRAAIQKDMIRGEEAQGAKEEEAIELQERGGRGGRMG